jgi:hypothetical protein
MQALSLQSSPMSSASLRDSENGRESQRDREGASQRESDPDDQAMAAVLAVVG